MLEKNKIIVIGTLQFVLLFLSINTCKAQSIESISIALQTESIAIPFTRVAPVHPGIEMGLTLDEKSKPHSVRRWNVYVGWFYHRELDQSLYIRGEYQINYSINNAVNFSLPLSVGYMHSFLNQPVYEQADNGGFEKKTQLGRPHALISSGIGVSYLKLGNIEPFVKYEASLQAPFASTIPILPRNFLKIGSNIRF